MNIFLREMKAHRKSLIIWSIGVLFMVAAGMGKYTAYSNTDQSFNDLISQMPRGLQTLFGAGAFDLSQVTQFYGVFFLYLVLMTTIHAVMLGANIIAKEERDKTAEFLFVKPASRNQIITAKLLAALVNIVVVNLVTSLSSIGIVGAYSKGEPVTGDIIILMVGMFILQLVFMVIGTGIAAVRKNPKTSASLATGILLVTFILSIAIDLNEKLESLKYFTPFKYFEAKGLLLGGGFEPIFVILSVAIIAILVSVTYVFYKKRDLHV